MFEEEIEYTANYFHQHMSGGSLAEKKAAIKDLVECCKTGNFKVGAILNCLRIIGVYPIVDMVLKLMFNKTINTIARTSFSMKRALELLLGSLHKYKVEHPGTWKKLVNIAKNTKQFNDTAIKAMIFMVTQCPQAIQEVLKAFADLNLIYAEMTKYIRGPMKWGMNLLFDLLCKALGFKNKEVLFARCNEHLHNIIDNVMKGFASVSSTGTLETILNLGVNVIKPMVNNADPIGVVFPIATYLCYDIIVARVEAGKIKLPMHPILKLIIIGVVITVIVYAVKYVKSLQAEQAAPQESFSVDITQGNKLIGNLGKKLSIVDDNVKIA